MEKTVDARKIVKHVVAFIVGAGVSKITHSIIEKNVEPEKKTEKVAVTAASFVIGSMAADATKNYTDEKIDKLFDWWQNEVKPKLP